jgi:hypothetical protein
LQVPKKQSMLALLVVLKATPARWKDAHREGVKDWPHYRRIMQVRFGTEVENNEHKYIGESDPTCHVEQCRRLWSSIQRQNVRTYLCTHWTQFQRTSI